MFFYNPSFYAVNIVLLVICIIHCVRTGRSGTWIWIMIVLPIIGSVIYIFAEMFTSRNMGQVQSGMSGVLNPGGKIRKLENNLKFSDTFNNRMLLADAYLGAGHTDKAITLYESSLTGNFTENEYPIVQLILAYFQQKRYADILPIAKKIYHRPQFARSKQHIYYAMALSFTGHNAEAEAEFKQMKGKFANFEASYQYGCFLIRSGRKEEAQHLYDEILTEFPHLTPREKRSNREWYNLTKEEMRNVKSKM